MSVLPKRLAVVSTLVAFGALAAEPPSVAEALKNLEAARSKLASAVKRIEVDPPSNEDLEAARVAVDHMQEVLTAGAALETSDLDYAKAVLTVRKELRGHREYVDQRRANVAVFELRRKIDAAQKVMSSKVAAELSAERLEEARAEVAEVKKLIAQGRPFTKQDAKFGPYLDGVDAAATKQEKALGDRWVQLSADKQRGLLDEASKGLSSALSDLASGFSDAKFEATDKAVALLAKRVAEGKPLEERDRGYRAEADKARAALAQAKVKTEEAVATAGVSRVKAELDAPYSELTSSMKALRGGRPTSEQLSEAKTAAFVVRKLVDKYAPQGARNPPIAQYLNSVKDVLNEAEVVLQTKALQAARADVNAALRALAKRIPSEDEFATAKTSIVVLEKTIEATTGKDAKLAAVVYDAKQAVRDSRAEVDKRRYQVDLTLQRSKADEARRSAGALVSQLYKEKASEQQLAEAEKAVKDAGEVLKSGSSFIKKDADYAAFDKETKVKLTELADRIARRRIILSAIDAKAQLVELIADARGKLEASKAASSTDADLDAAMKSVELVSKTIDERAPLETQDGSFAAYAQRARNDLMRLMESLDMASRMRTLRKATGEALSGALSALADAERTDDAHKKKSLYESASARLKSCKEEGPKLLLETPKLSSLDILVSGQPLKPKEVIAQCAEKADNIPDALKQSIAQVRFEDGPKKAYESAKALLNKGKRDEAKTQFDECFASGAIEAHRYPELKERKRSVGGVSLSLGELIQKCDAERKALRAEK